MDKGGFDLGTSLEELTERLKPNVPLKQEVQKNSMVFTKLGDLFLEPMEKIKWLVDGLLPTGGFSIIVAKPKVGKSTLARGLALSVATGESFLDKEVSKGAVIYLALEEKRSEVKEHFQVLGATGNEDIYIYVGGAPADAISEIRNAVEEIKPALVIIDPLFRFTKVKDGNDYHQVTNALDPLLRLARDTGTHVLCVHHSKKGESAAEDSFLGSQAIFGSVDTLMIMKRCDHYRTLQTIQRYGDDLPETILSFDKDSRSISLGSGKQEEDVNIMGNAIIEFLQEQKEPVVESLINQNIEGSTKLKCKALRELVSKDKVKREGTGKRNDPFRYSTFSTSLLPSIYTEVEKEKRKNVVSPCDISTNSTSGNFPLFQNTEVGTEAEKEHREQQKIAADSTSKDEAKTQNLNGTSDEIIALDEFEIIGGQAR